MNKYLKEAKNAARDSKSKELLFEAVENLSNALKEVQNSGNFDLQGMTGDRNFYRKYCDHAAELLKDTEEKTPFAAKTIIKGLPILDRNLKEILDDIQEKARITCEKMQGTSKEEACTIYKQVQLVTSNPINAAQNIEALGLYVKSKLAANPENKEILD